MNSAPVPVLTPESQKTPTQTQPLKPNRQARRHPKKMQAQAQLLGVSQLPPQAQTPNPAPHIGGGAAAQVGISDALAYQNDPAAQAELMRLLGEQLAQQQQGQQQQGQHQPDTQPETVARRTRQTKLDKACLGLYGMVGGLVFFANQTDGAIIFAQAQERARELAALAEHYPWLKDLIFQITEKSDLMSFVAGHAALAGALMAAHGTSAGDVWRKFWGPVQSRRTSRKQTVQSQEQPVPVGAGPVTSPFSDDIGPIGPISAPVPPESAEQNGLDGVNPLYDTLDGVRR
jgi:hypothetical protein